MGDAELMRQALIKLPDFFVEGWLVVGFIRVVALGDMRFILPFGKSDNADDGRDRKMVLAGILIYVITQLGFAAYNQGLITLMPSPAGETQAEIDPPQLFVIMLGILVVLFFFRFLWLFIPAGIGVSIKDLISNTHSAFYSLKLFFVWLVSILPPTLIFFGVMGLTAGEHADKISNAPLTVVVSMALMQSVYEIIIALIQAGAIYYAFFYDRHDTSEYA